MPIVDYPAPLVDDRPCTPARQPVRPGIGSPQPGLPSPSSVPPPGHHRHIPHWGDTFREEGRGYAEISRDSDEED